MKFYFQEVLYLRFPLRAWGSPWPSAWDFGSAYWKLDTTAIFLEGRMTLKENTQEISPGGQQQHWRELQAWAAASSARTCWGRQVLQYHRPLAHRGLSCPASQRSGSRDFPVSPGPCNPNQGLSPHAGKQDEGKSQDVPSPICFWESSLSFLPTPPLLHRAA